MRIRFITSACVELTYSDGYRVLCDPWLTEGIYYNTWFHNPPLQGATPPKSLIKEGRINIVTPSWIDYFNTNPPDALYISHMHWDHLDPGTLNAFTFKDVPVYTGPFKINLKPIKKIVESCGFKLSPKSLTDRFLIQKAAGLEFDSFALFCDLKTGVHTINMNDCVYEDVKDQIRDLPCISVDFACLPYSGAGPYPQCFEMSDAEKQVGKNLSMGKYLSWLRSYCLDLKPRAVLPFAGQYKLADESLNKWLAIPDLAAVKCEVDETGAMYCVPKEGAVYYAGMEKLVNHAREHLLKYWKGSETTLILQTESARHMVLVRDVKKILEIKLSDDLLWDLLTKKKHWNNAELAGLLKFKREGEYDKELHFYLSYFHI